MATGEIQSDLPMACPTWVPKDVRHYLAHTVHGCSIRAVARDAGVHASTILRQVRRNETRRDDPLLDDAFDRLAEFVSLKSPHIHKDRAAMIVSTPTPNLPSEKKIEAEARRILRRLAEPGACLAIAPMMEKAVVVRETDDGKTIRTAIVDREVAEAFVVKDWIEHLKHGKVTRYVLSNTGRSALKRMISEHDCEKNGFAEAPAIFADQHRETEIREMGPITAGKKKRVRFNFAESPLTAIARRKGKDGNPYLNNELIAAGERLREDFELSQIGPSVAQNWDHFLTGGMRGSFGSGGNDSQDQARKRVSDALSELGPGLADVVLRICCFLEGIEQAEKRMGWSARSGKIVLKIALQRLSRHYQERGHMTGLMG